jgi:hypothetical protein
MNPWVKIPAGMKYMFATECSNRCRDEGHDREPDTEELADRIICTDTEQDSEVDEPVAGNTLEEC